MKKHRRISINPARIEAARIGNNKSHLNFVVKTKTGFTNYGITVDTNLLIEMVDMLKRGISFEKVTPEAWVSFSDRKPTEPGEYVMRDLNGSLLAFRTLERMLGMYHNYGASEWRKL